MPGAQGTGTVKLWNAEKGFGFVVCDDGAADVFIHFRNILDGDLLQKGEKVGDSLTLGLFPAAPPCLASNGERRWGWPLCQHQHQCPTTYPTDDGYRSREVCASGAVAHRSRSER